MERCTNIQATAEILNNLLLLINLKVSNIDLFEYVDSQERGKQYSLIGMILYYKCHYLCVFYEKEKWLLYDDHLFCILNDWRELINKIKQNVYIPIVLYYKEDARPNIDLVKEDHLEMTLNSQLLNNKVSIYSESNSYDKAIYQESYSLKKKINVSINESNQKERFWTEVLDRSKFNEDFSNLKKEVILIDNNIKTNPKSNNTIKNKMILSTFFANIKTNNKTICNSTSTSELKQNDDNCLKSEVLNKVPQNKAYNNKITLSLNTKIKETNTKTQIIDANVSIPECKKLENNFCKEYNFENHAMLYSIQTQNKSKSPDLINKLKSQCLIDHNNEWHCKKCNVVNLKEKYCCKSCFNINLELYLNLKQCNLDFLATKPIQNETINQTKQKENIINQLNTKQTEQLSTEGHFQLIAASNQKELSYKIPHKTQMKKSNLNKNIQNESNNCIVEQFDIKDKTAIKPLKKKICIKCEGTLFYETKCTNCGTEFKQ